MSRSTLKPQGPAQKGFQTQTIDVLPSIKLDLAGIIETPTPIAVATSKPHVYSGGRKPTVEFMNKFRENVAGMNAMEQGSPISEREEVQYSMNEESPPPRGNTKMQGLRAKGEGILKKAKDEGRMLSRNEQLKLKSIQSRRVKEYKKNKD